MNQNFKHGCSRRSIPTPSNLDRIAHGAGSGGGPEQGSAAHYHDGTYAVIANQVQILSAPPMPPTEPVPYLVSVLAAGMGTDGRVEVGGSQGVRLTAGPPMMPPASSESTNGVEIIVGELQNITIQRGLLPMVDQKILLEPGSTMIDGGAGPITIQSLSEIKLQVAEGLSSITLTPAGIIIQGLLIAIN